MSATHFPSQQAALARPLLLTSSSPDSLCNKHKKLFNKHKPLWNKHKQLWNKHKQSEGLIKEETTVPLVMIDNCGPKGTE